MEDKNANEEILVAVGANNGVGGDLSCSSSLLTMVDEKVKEEVPVVVDGSNDGGVADISCSSSLPIPKPKPNTKYATSISLPPFLIVLYNIVSDPSLNSMISWSQNRNSFIVFDSVKLCTEIFPKWFRHNNMTAFIHQLNNYGFQKISWERLEFANKHFLPGKPELMKNIERKDKKQPKKAYDELTKLKKEQNRLNKFRKYIVQKQNNMEKTLTKFKARIQDAVTKQETVLTLLTDLVKDIPRENRENSDKQVTLKRKKSCAEGSTDITMEPNQVAEKSHESKTQIVTDEGWSWESIIDEDGIINFSKFNYTSFD